MPDTIMNKVAVVTGAGSGVGRCTVNALLEAGYHIAAVGRRLDMLKTTLDPRVHAFACDVGDAAQVTTTIAAIVERMDRIDCLVNSAGIFRPAAAASITS